MGKKILYHYKTRAGYNADKANIPADALVFIKNDKSIVTHGTEYRYVLPTATASALGGVKVGYTSNGKNYKVQLDSGGNAFVNVPWTDTNTEYGAMKSTAYGLGKVFSDTVQSVGANNVSATAGRTYGVQKNINGQLVVNVPWANTTYGVATQSANGLMSKEDKKMLDLMRGALYFSLWQNSTRNIEVGTNSVTIHNNGFTVIPNGGTDFYYVGYVSGQDTGEDYVMSSTATNSRKFYLLDTSVLQAGKRVAFSKAIKTSQTPDWLTNGNLVLLCSFYNGKLDTDCGLMADVILGAKIKALEDKG